MSKTIVERRPNVLTKILVSPRSSNLAILGFFVVIFAFFAIASPSGTFLSAGNIEAIALSASQVLILGAGVTFLLIAGGLDLSVGSIIVFAAVTTASITASLTKDLVGDARGGWAVGAPILLGIVAGLIVGLGWGLLNGLVVVRLRIPPFIATLASATIILGLTQVWTGGLNVAGAPPEMQQSFGLAKLFGVIPWPVVVAIVIVAILWVVLACTRFGMRIYAIGANPESARRAGINVNAYTVSLYALVGLLSAVVGVIDVARFTTATVSGYADTALAVITAVVIGGTSLWGGRGTMGGTVIGSLIPATLASGFVILGLPPFWQEVAVGAVLLLAVTADQQRRRKLGSF
ncbi:ABC transporter permease [Leifsonia sp. RAF41]|uniref:ABC transporter permease n=1 Tax=Leifsonia sp. RAF41 TaxID=3233056 RepID=UPI003F997433